MRKFIVRVGMLACVFYPVGAAVVLGGLIFRAEGMATYVGALGIWGIYVIGFILGLVAEEYLD